MAKERKPRIIPESRTTAQEIVAAGETARDKAKKAPKFTEADLVWNDRETMVVKGNQYQNDVWNHSPAQLQFLSSAYQMLHKVAERQGAPTTKVTKVRIAYIKGTKMILVRPTRDDDPDGLELTKAGSSHWLNAISVLAPARLTVDSGYRERHTVSFAPDDFPGGPALLINLGKSLERVLNSSKANQPATTATITAHESTPTPTEPTEEH